MNTYNVNLDGFFATEVGRVYGEVRDKILPYLRREREGAKALYASDAACIEKLGAFASRLDEACTTLKDLVRESNGMIGKQSFYRRVKIMAESSGMASAFEEWKRAVAYSKKMAQ